MLKALEDRVIVEPIDEDKDSEAGYTLEVRTEKPIKWVVIDVGPGRTLDSWSRENMDLCIWDIVYFTKYAPDEFFYKDKRYFSLKQSTILSYNRPEPCEK